MSNSSVETKVHSFAVDQAYMHCQFNEIEQILRQLRLEDPDLYALLDKRKVIDEVIQVNEKNQLQAIVETAALAVGNLDALPEPLYHKRLAQKILKEKIATHQEAIHAQHVAANAVITPRTNARNIKQPHKTIAEETNARSDKLSEQIQAWRSLLPTLIAGFKKIKDPRRAKSVTHQLIVIMLYALFAFIFRLKSRREMNRELTGVAIHEHLQKLFPELTSIPHADTIARLLERININDIEKTHMRLINQLIRNKKFKKLLINGALPIAIDGTQKVYREGEWQDLYWLTRKVGTKDSQSTQQYVYVLEATIVFKNGLTIPLLSEYLQTDWSVLENPDGKRECELVAFERLTGKLKRYFPRLKFILFADALFANQPVLEKLAAYNWDYIIQFSKNRLTDFAKILNAMKKDQQTIPNQLHYREREQAFYWYNNVPWGYDLKLNIHLVSCL